ncbi:glutathione peroxidase [Azoarcus indigens]|uniref:Glutathione peroxidase n=1 Tax=Azoarcus indigens TaxID=29545 RepID=A0A4R6DQN4_9RHOO|nr:glutathione peroxidase [Azoarcus indigens]NMG66906.1 glutathione peroxidase [Azoarcus indigens]TDN47213.1 glutathione peroxidase [Azoarcus indigens]
MSEPTVFDFETRSLDGVLMPLAAFRGQVLLVVNTASECGFTPQYQGLQAIHERYREKGFSVIGFPCNQFGGQEPGDAKAIAAFCERNYGVTFPLSEKVEVKGAGAHPLFVHLTKAAPGVLGTEAIKWNFTKFLVDREGRVVDRYAPTTKPESLAGDIEKLL